MLEDEAEANVTRPRQRPRPKFGLEASLALTFYYGTKTHAVRVVHGRLPTRVAGHGSSIPQSDK